MAERADRLIRCVLGEQAKAGNARVSKKISHLMHSGEAKSQKQVVAMALSMERSGRIRDDGSYVPVKEGFQVPSSGPAQAPTGIASTHRPGGVGKSTTTPNKSSITKNQQPTTKRQQPWKSYSSGSEYKSGSRLS